MAKHLIYLAAGSGRRFGGNKLLYPLEGRPLFSYGLETLRRAMELLEMKKSSFYERLQHYGIK